MYAAFETLTEPHQLFATLQCVAVVGRPLLGDVKGFPEGRAHLFPLLTMTLPGIDPNDYKKTLVCAMLIFDRLCYNYSLCGGYPFFTTTFIFPCLLVSLLSSLLCPSLYHCATFSLPFLYPLFCYLPPFLPLYSISLPYSAPPSLHPSSLPLTFPCVQASAMLMSALLAMVPIVDSSKATEKHDLTEVSE